MSEGISGELRIDYIDFPKKYKNFQLGLTILPGRKDRGRILEDDIQKIKSEGITHVVCMLTEDEFHKYGVDDLKESYEKNGLDVLSFPIMDYGIPTHEQMKEGIQWVYDNLQKKHAVLIHCVGGLGRSGTFAAALLIDKLKLPVDEAIDIVRKSRSERAIESREQLDFLSEFE